MFLVRFVTVLDSLNGSVTLDIVLCVSCIHIGLLGNLGVDFSSVFM